jgi:hypothetical protein
MEVITDRVEDISTCAYFGKASKGKCGIEGTINTDVEDSTTNQ